MSKSQNTKKDLCITSEQLTEQWKKGELPSGEYYIIDDLGLHTTDKYYPSHGFGTELPQSVLGRVPTFDELQNMNKAVNECMAANIKLVEENAQLKELLKECKEWFNWYYIDTGTGKEYIESWHKKGHEIHKQLDEALR